MISNFKIILATCIMVVAILTAGLMFIFVNSDTNNNNILLNSANIKQTSIPQASNKAISFSETSLTDDSLINSSDLIVRGKFLKIKERAVSEVKNKGGSKIASGNEDYELAEVEVPYVVYEFDVSENLTDESSSLKTVNVVMVDADTGLGLSDNLFEEKGEYVLFLHKNPNGTYSLVSYSQGICKYKENTKEYENNGDKKVNSYSKLKANIAKRHKK